MLDVNILQNTKSAIHFFVKKLYFLLLNFTFYDDIFPSWKTKQDTATTIFRRMQHLLPHLIFIQARQALPSTQIIGRIIRILQPTLFIAYTCRYQAVSNSPPWTKKKSSPMAISTLCHAVNRSDSALLSHVHITGATFILNNCLNFLKTTISVKFRLKETVNMSICLKNC